MIQGGAKGNLEVIIFHSEFLRLSLVSHIFFWTMNTMSSSGSELESAVATASQCKADRYFLTKSITGCLSRMIAKPLGLRMRSISSNKSSALQPFFSISEKTVQAWSRSYVRGYVEKASHLPRLIQLIQILYTIFNRKTKIKGTCATYFKLM